MAVELKTDDDFLTTINNNDKVIVKYYADWCGSCRLFGPKFKRLSEDDRFSDGDGIVDR
ncbi:MAG: thioredoxin domain-containing protein, partial [Ekhidna sp.]